MDFGICLGIRSRSLQVSTTLTELPLSPSHLPSGTFRYPYSVMPANKTGSAKGKAQEPSLLDELVGVVSAQKAAFCCGESIQVSDNEEKLVSRFENLTFDDGKATPGPIVLRWDPPSGKTIRKLTLPSCEDVNRAIAIEGLLQDCGAATFGKAGEEVLDESYRKAAKLDANQFSTNFNPLRRWYCRCNRADPLA